LSKLAASAEKAATYNGIVRAELARHKSHLEKARKFQAKAKKYNDETVELRQKLSDLGIDFGGERDTTVLKCDDGKHDATVPTNGVLPKDDGKMTTPNGVIGGAAADGKSSSHPVLVDRSPNIPGAVRSPKRSLPGGVQPITRRTRVLPQLCDPYDVSII